ncbi:hypothetical protein CA13_32680 [Planctomycetes bacterium CA13]|uniref:Uncharacterized protein n=1 Tax=Novipirellula herctigrandis TaxID=2527986 RepID=A0A5C5Z3N1_9BACT|nr:hypothetical protein CA13_32680 [Planctomycetes bacterium CA13]
MKSHKVFLSITVIVCSLSFPGCGRDGNTVIEPGEPYQMTEIEKKNAEQNDREREEENRR